jgi:hypothetical protein
MSFCFGLNALCKPRSNNCEPSYSVRNDDCDRSRSDCGHRSYSSCDDHRDNNCGSRRGKCW